VRIYRISPLDISSVPARLEGLHELAKCGHWRALVDFSSKLLTEEMFERNETETLDIVLQLRFQGLFKMKMFDDLTAEIAKVMMSELKSRADSPLSPKLLSLISLMCEVKSVTGRGDEALEQLYRARKQLLNTRVDDNVLPLRFWKTRIRCQIVNILLRQRQWQLALFELGAILNEIREAKHLVVGSGSSDQSPIASRSKSFDGELMSLTRSELYVLCRISRIYLQVINILCFISI
jgi:hypothetical protein